MRVVSGGSPLESIADPGSRQWFPLPIDGILTPTDLFAGDASGLRGENVNEPYERLSPLRAAAKRALVDPLANYLPPGLLKGLLRFGKSELAASNWADPGGWRSMVISYDGNPPKLADKILVSGGVMGMALRNRLRLASGLIRDLINAGAPPVHVLCLGAGPGQITLRAMAAAEVESEATLVDLNPDSFDYGRDLAASYGLTEKVRYIHGDVNDVRKMLDNPPAVVKMIGICEYLTDEQITDIVAAVAEVMPAGAPIVFNNITHKHGNDRFFRRVLGLHMVHRSVEELSDLMARAGFGDFEVHPEPLGVYNVIVGRRGAVGSD